MNNKLEALTSRLLAKRDEAIKGRAASGVEQRWRTDEAMVDDCVESGGAASMLDYASGEATYSKSNEPRRSKVVINIIRGKCEQTEGRFADIQLPVDDKNWGLKATPVPELALQMRDKTPVASNGEPVVVDGKEITLADLAQNEVAIATEKMEAMEKEIEDQLVECSFNGECRKALRDAVRLGTGILKGPSVIKQIRKAWRKDEAQGVYVLEVVEEHTPYSKRCNPWFVYPDPYCGDNIKKAAYIWEKDMILPRELRRLQGVKGYMSDQIEQILSEEPVRTNVVQGKSGHEINKTSIDQGSNYEIWEYHGDLTVDELDLLRCDCEGLRGSVSACVVFVNDKPIKAVLNLLDTGDLPYDFFQWTQVNDSVWGIGIPRILMWVQRVITAAWRAMMDNAGDSSGANVVVGEGITPDDDIWEITGKKLWRYNGDMQDVNKAFAQFQISNNQADLQRIIELALRFSDLETSLPMAFAGEQVGPAETLGAVELKIDSSNVALRSRVKLWDDAITRPHLTRYYHWNMQYNESDDCKGDYNVDPRGVSVLLQKEKAVQAIAQLLPLRGDALFSQIVDWEKAIKHMFSAQQIDILKSDEEIAAAKKKMEEQPPIDPKTAAATETVKMRAELEQAKIQANQENLAISHKVDIEQAELQRAHEKEMAMLRREEKMLELSIKSGDSLDKIKADLAKESMKLNVQKELSGRTQVATPPTEPAGRAPEGHAYEA